VKTESANPKMHCSQLTLQKVHDSGNYCLQKVHLARFATIMPYLARFTFMGSVEGACVMTGLYPAANLACGSALPCPKLSESESY